MMLLLLVTLCGILTNSAAFLNPPYASSQQRLRNVDSTRDNDHDISKSSLLAFHRKLVEIKSISDDEGAVGEYIVSYLRAHDFTVTTQEVPFSTGSSTSPSTARKPRTNVLAFPPGYSSSNSTHIPILLTSHIDTVPPFIPYSRSPNPTRPSNPTVSGRGSVDAKACVAAQTHALLSLLSTSSHEPSHQAVSKRTALLFVVGEETLGDGMHAFSNRNHTFSTVIFGEPTESKLASGHKGIMGFTLHARGKAAHSGYPWLGLSANSLLIRALSALSTLSTTPEPSGGLPSSPKYGNSTLNIGVMSGGVAANVIAASASARVAVRLAASTPEAFRSIFQRTIDSIDSENLSLQYWGPGYGPVDLDTDVAGFETISVNYGTDIPNLRYDGSYKRYLYGPGSILVAHGEDEALTVSDLEGAVEGYKKLILAGFERDSKESWV